MIFDCYLRHLLESQLLDKSYISPIQWLFLFRLELLRLGGVVAHGNSDAKLWFYGAVNDCFWLYYNILAYCCLI